MPVDIALSGAAFTGIHVNPAGYRRLRGKDFMKPAHGSSDSSSGGAEAALREVQAKFRHFTRLLESHNQIMRLTSDMEEKSQGEYLFDINYIRSSLEQIREQVAIVVPAMIDLGGPSYKPLSERAEEIMLEIEEAVPTWRGIPEDNYAISVDRLNRHRAGSVGSKMAQLGEMKTKLGLTVPDGFAISAWAYKRFIDVNDLQARINRMIESLNITRYQDLVSVSRRIRRFIMAGSIPDDVVNAIQQKYGELMTRCPGKRLAVRSSAIGEDTLYSFAGQYATYLNVRGREMIDRYREVLASAFTPQAIYYFLSHSFTASTVAMSAGCVTIVDAVAAGVIYTRSPIPQHENCVLISSIWGLGKYLVEGRLTPDSFCLNRNTGQVNARSVARKRVRLVLDANGGTREEPVPAGQQEAPSVTDEQLQQLLAIARRIEDHYGAAQDIEFAIDREGKINLLQTRPLRLSPSVPEGEPIDRSGLVRVLDGGMTVSSGVGGGPVYHATSVEDLAGVPDGAVLVTPNSFPGIITVMGKVSAIVTGVGGVANHMATLAREYQVPTVGGLKEARHLKTGLPVTVDARVGVIYEGIQETLIRSHRSERDLLEDMAIFVILESVMNHITPLHMLHPDSEEFSIDNCRTLHDLTRFVHQKAMEEMFSGAMAVRDAAEVSLQLKTDMPMQVHVVYIDREPPDSGKRMLPVGELDSRPMEAYWKGVVAEGWPRATLPSNFVTLKGATIGQNNASGQAAFRETSYAILGREYMVFNVHMGYHFASVESMYTPESSKNYIRMEYKDGGAPLDRRIRRINLIAGILKQIGFENKSSADYLNAVIAYLPPHEVEEKLILLGRLTMMTKQLDMALSSDGVAEWYMEDFLRKLGVRTAGEGME